MAEIRLAYGRSGLTVDLPSERTTVISPADHPAAADPMAVLTRALREPVTGPPLRDRLRGKATVAVSLCDATRPQPRVEMITAILDETGIDPDAVTLLVATGTHRGNTLAELREMLGDYAGTMRVINHDGRDPDQTRWCGEYGNGVPVRLNKHWLDADARITTGFVEPHFFAGFSGGPKLVAPGLAALETVLTLHDARRIGDANAIWGVCEGNPVHDDVRAIADGTGVDFAFDVVLNREQRILAAYGGDLLPMHKTARERVREISMQPVDELFDVVVTSNSGFPLDQNLYQAVKGMSAAMTVVKPGGLIISVAACEDGFPDHGSFREVLASEKTPQDLLAAINARTETVPDQWQVQILARILCHARVGVHTGGLTDADLRTAHLYAVPDIAAAVAAEGPDARICVLPEGPQTIPYRRDR